MFALFECTETTIQGILIVYECYMNCMNSIQIFYNKMQDIYFCTVHNTRKQISLRQKDGTK